MTPSIVVFDIGNVLVDWQPHKAWLKELGTPEACQAFMDRIDFSAFNLRGDGGETFADMARELSDPDDARRLMEYVDHYPLTMTGVVPGSWEILDRLQARGVPTHAITNWSAETWPLGLSVHPRLGEVFGTTIVSGQEHMIKPDARIFDLLCARAGVAASDCVFIDDSPRNVDGAKAAGMDAIHFVGAQDLETQLQTRGLL